MSIRLLAITPPRGLVDPAIVDAWRGAFDHGFALVLRRPGATVAATLLDPELQPLCERARADGLSVLCSCDPADADGPAQAVDAGLLGVQLRSDPDAAAVASARRAGAVIVGASMHAPAPLALPPADFLSVAPIFAPRTTDPLRTKTPIGCEGLAAFSARGVPVLALGGVTAANAARVLAAGADGIASIRSFFGPPAEVVENVAGLCAALARGPA